MTPPIFSIVLMWSLQGSPELAIHTEAIPSYVRRPMSTASQSRSSPSAVVLTSRAVHSGLGTSLDDVPFVAKADIKRGAPAGQGSRI